MKSFISAIYNSTKPNRCSTMCAILYNKSSVISIGWNSPLPHAKIFRLTLNLPSTHAEVEVIRKVIFTRTSPTKKRLKANLIVLKQNKSGQFTNSKPCKNCIEFMKSDLVSSFLNLRNITFFENNDFQTVRLSDLTTDHISFGWSKFYR